MQAIKSVGSKKNLKQFAQFYTSYAAQQNARYDVTESSYVDIKKRYNETISNLPPMKQKGIRAQIIAGCNEFRKRYPHVKKFTDLNLAEAKLTPLAHILIDVTIQRLLDLGWVAEILKNFREVQADPIKLYEVIDGGDLVDHYPVGTILYASWDAQHTAVVYWIIAAMILGEREEDVKVPSVIYKIKYLSDTRQNFVNTNSKAGKHLLEPIDLFAQMVLGVRRDGSTDPKWMEAERKQTYLTEADLFVTHEKFANTEQPGAISRMAEIDKYTSDIIRQFCMYSTTIPVPRFIASQEIEIMCAWFDMAKNAGIHYTDDQIVDLGDHIHDLFDADFHESSTFWDKVKVAYVNWHKVYYKQFPTNMRPAAKMSKNWNTGGTFLWHQLAKTWNGPIPPLNNSTPFIPDVKDLY
jgi:hypothetical protein